MTRTTTRRQNGWIIALLCAVCLIGGLALTAEPAHAAGGTINVTYSQAVDNFDTTFKVYKVGSFENGNDLVWDSAFSGLTLPDVSEKNFSGEDKMDKWREALIKAGTTLQAALESAEDPIEIEGYPLNCPISKATGTGSVSVTEDGLYLIIGPQESVSKGGVTTNYIPVPGFVTVFDGRSVVDIAIKADENHAKYFQVYKEWKAGEKDKKREELLRPEGIKIGIFYRDSADADWTKAEEVTLNEDNEWFYKWNTENIQREWSVQEILPEGTDAYYETSQGKEVADQFIRYTVTNTFKQRSLKLTKVIDEFVKHNDNVATTIVFRIDGYKDNEIVYSVPASIDFTSAGSRDTIIDSIPANLDRIEVTEVYTANYEPKDGKTTATATGPNADGVYEVSFDNGWSKTVDYDSGIINKYGLSNQDDLGDGYKILERLGLREDKN